MASRVSYREMMGLMVAAMRHTNLGVGNPFAQLGDLGYYSRGKGGKRAHSFSGVRKAQRAATKRRNIAKWGTH